LYRLSQQHWAEAAPTSSCHWLLPVLSPPISKIAQRLNAGARGFEQNLAVAVEQAMPVYLRDKIAKKKP
jgi:hypothetical protein